MNTYTLGSLFDGSGGFPLAGSLCGVTPVWAAEIEPYPIAVTRSRFPNMIHLGDVSKINGAEIPPVDIITFGSPCQDLSVAGQRAGLKHKNNGDDETTRSGLFMEAVRIIKEMREATNGRYPTFALWENVPGAFSSNKGEDFRVVLEELIKIIEPTATVPAADKNGWPYADCYMGDGWSLAYRVFDAQFWGVPQRRRRIHLIFDLRGERAGEILFKREGLRGYFEESRQEREEATRDAENSVGTADCAGKCVTYDARGNGDGKIVSTITGDHNNRITDYTSVVCYCLQGNGIDRADTAGCNGKGWREGVCYTLNTIDRPVVAHAMQAFGDYKDCGVAKGPSAVCVKYIVRRLTPTECARLQGFPDKWGHPDRKEDLTEEEYRFWLDVRNTHAAINGKAVKDYTPAQMLTWYNKLHVDSSEYKMWGNGIALPPAVYCMQGMVEALCE